MYHASVALTLADVQRHSFVVPWPEQRQVEQDLLLSLAMVAVFQDDFLSSQVAMRGGTLLHKVYLPPPARYSEDIDLVVVGKRPKEHIRAALKRVLRPVLGTHTSDLWATVKLAVRNAAKRSQVLRLEYEIASVVSPVRRLKLKVEANVSERVPFMALARIPFSVPFRSNAWNAEIVSYDINEVLGTKMRALFQRMQGRDLFDLYWGFSGSAGPAPSPAKAVAAFQHYMEAERSAFTRQDFVEALDARLASRGFRSDMSALLRTGLDYDVDEAGMLVKTKLLSRIPA